MAKRTLQSTIVLALAFLCLAGVVDYFVVPLLLEKGESLVQAVLIGSCLVGAGAVVLVTAGYQLVDMVRTMIRRRKNRT